MKHFFTLLFLVGSLFSFSQNQTVRGHLVDADTYSSIQDALIEIIEIGPKNSNNKYSCKEILQDGSFTIPNVKIGEYQLVVNATNYEVYYISSFLVNSAKESVFIIELIPKPNFGTTASTITIRANEMEVKNEYASVSARGFSPKETEQYAGSRGDPARMASNFAGVQGADDSRNDIVIRGNSPAGVRWRLEGIDIPNPNHFSIPGTAGGPVSIINNKTLANSDFYSGAFPAEFGNGIAGVFDLRMKNGNSNKREYSFQFGFLGTEIFSEGPINKKTSYLLSYRYSTLQLFNYLGISIGTSAVPAYQDGAFRINHIFNSKKKIALWGLGGLSSVDIMISQQRDTSEQNLYGDNDRDQHFKTRTLVVGSTYEQTINDKNYIKASIAFSQSNQLSAHNLVYRHVDQGEFVLDSLANYMRYNFNENRTHASFTWNHKPSDKLLMRLGFQSEINFIDYRDSILNTDLTSAQYYQWNKRWNKQTHYALVQPFAQIKYYFTPKLQASFGVHTNYYSLSNCKSYFEPRLSVKYKTKPGDFSFGLGVHSQQQSPYLLFYAPQGTAYNSGLAFTKSYQSVIGFSTKVSLWNILFEAYYQYLTQVPVTQIASSFSGVNSGAGFSRLFPQPLQNTGFAQNKGIELTLQRQYDKGLLALFTASVFDSKYLASDQQWRNTDFNGKFAMNALVSKAWKLGVRKTFTLGTKVTWVGGRWYGPVDSLQTVQQRDIVFSDMGRNTMQFPNYFRWDIKTNYRYNTSKLTHEFGVDIVNVLNTKNILKLSYTPSAANFIRQEYQLGLLPLFYYKIDF